MQGLTSYFTIQHPNVLETIECHGFWQAVQRLYQQCYSYGIQHLTNVKLISHYDCICIETFDVSYDTGIILKNNRNTIVTTSIFPEFLVFDSMIRNAWNRPLINTSTAPNLCNQKMDTSNPIRISKTNSRHPFYEESLKRVHLRRVQEQKLDSQPISPNLDLPVDKPPIVRISETEPMVTLCSNPKPESNTVNKRRCEYIDDKRCYLQIKKDIANGRIRPFEIHPVFMFKYEIFKILENREAINIENNDNVDVECAKFAEFMDFCHNEEQEEKPKDKKQSFVPHNFFYLTKEQKQDIASKHNMSLEEYTKYAEQQEPEPLDYTIKDVKPLLDLDSDSDSSSDSSYDAETDCTVSISECDDKSELVSDEEKLEDI